ncbi:UDP-glucuronosyl/UDP-glucosyltransferase [Artemisia annua]|uniref:UDP-glucuronosyl/UDP-glucosyltransferase n=1 Tax=Artemisia annua TaxID=35608 RepID=A0A2U1NWA2_ARTAN|nr:UDP-glucuronosyl/UDP-glucosyltransferase [Artemisia annua]
MDAHGDQGTLLRLPTPTHRRVILFPLPFQGHINPMLQLASILHAQGFKIIISISDEIKDNMPMGEEDPIFTLKYLNRRCVIPFRDCVAGLLDEEPVACLITDAGFYFTQAVADDLKLPQLVLRTSSLACILVYGSYPLFCQKGYIDLPDSNSDTRAAGYSPLKEKDITKIATNKDGMEDFIISMFKQMKASSGIIFNTFKELEEPAQETIYQDFQVPNFTLGPFHKYFSVSTSSLIEQDRTILLWLDNQLPKSTIYASFGSEACITESEFQQVAHTLANVGYPFLWVVRPGSVTGYEWVESLPDKLLERLRERGQHPHKQRCRLKTVDSTTQDGAYDE